MVELVTGDLFRSDAVAYVNAVNTVGVMGAGIARQFRTRFPTMYRAYVAACAAGDVQIGRMHVFDRGPVSPSICSPRYGDQLPCAAYGGPRYIFNFPTKRHWREPSDVEYIRAGLDDLLLQVRVRRVYSIAIPALGCQLGGLRWEVVEPILREALEPATYVRAQLYTPR